MSATLNQVESERGKIESLLGKLPGYKGYKDKEMRRESDMILRDAIARDLTQQLGRLPAMQEDLLRGGHIELQGDMGAIATALQTLIDRVKTAAKGYAGFFDAVRVKEDELDALMQYDEQIGAEVPKIGAAFDALGASIEGGGDVKGAIKSARNAVKALNDTFAKRSGVITAM